MAQRDKRGFLAAVTSARAVQMHRYQEAFQRHQSGFVTQYRDWRLVGEPAREEVFQGFFNVPGVEAAESRQCLPPAAALALEGGNTIGYGVQAVRGQRAGQGRR